MNFVDIQPKSFLDYAWTTPSPALTNVAKPSKTNRKQNRCCDQCRKGKRACDAAILEDTLLDTTGSCASNPTVFHYSDVFGPLTPCANCEKTKKNCTFEWLRSQRILQAAPQSSTVPPAKRRRTQSSSSKSSESQNNSASQLQATEAPHSTTPPDKSTTNGSSLPARRGPAGLGLTFADFPIGIPVFEFDEYPLILGGGGSLISHTVDSVSQNESFTTANELEVEEERFLNDDSAETSLFKASSESTYGSPEGETLYGFDRGEVVDRKQESKPNNEGLIRIRRKRRRRSSSSTASNNRTSYQPTVFSNKLLSSTNRVFLSESLLKVYHDSFENALACWLTERTCPYGKGSGVSLANDTGPDWNLIYHRVFRLDRLSLPIRGRHLTCTEDQAASKAINFAIFSFATQWAQSSPKRKARYPFCSDSSGGEGKPFELNGIDNMFSNHEDFDRTLQKSAWHEARVALQNAAEIESFRVVLAQIVFSMTQRPMDMPEADFVELEQTSERRARAYSERERPQLGDKDLNECEELLSKLNLTMDGDGPPIHLEQGLRLIHSLRSRMAMAENVKKASTRCGKSSKLSPNRLDATDRATVDLLFWLGIMFDTLSSAMHKRPLVVSDEDSDIYSNNPRSSGAGNMAALARLSDSASNTEGLWDGYLFARQSRRLQTTAVRWPCSHEQAASLLCDAAPVKVLLFRKVTRIQTLLSRHAYGGRVEKAVRAALTVCDHWGRLYAPFIRDCIEHHDSLPLRIQSWYICLTGHWNLATLLLADLIEMIDRSDLGVESQRHERISTGFVAGFRVTSSIELSNLARCACPRQDATFSQSREFHFAVSEGALLTEPWTAVLIRAFAKAGAVLLDTEVTCTSNMHEALNGQDPFRRADDCVKALWYLGKKSDMALTTAKILKEALNERQKKVEEKINDMSSFLEVELWEGYNETSATFRSACV